MNVLCHKTLDDTNSYFCQHYYELPIVFGTEIKQIFDTRDLGFQIDCGLNWKKDSETIFA